MKSLYFIFLSLRAIALTSPSVRPSGRLSQFIDSMRIYYVIYIFFFFHGRRFSFQSLRRIKCLLRLNDILNSLHGRGLGLKSIKLIVITIFLLTGGALTANAYTINGKYASLISCDYGYSAVRGESGYTGTYNVMGEIWTVYFGRSYCKY